MPVQFQTSPEQQMSIDNVAMNMALLTNAVESPNRDPNLVARLAFNTALELGIDTLNAYSGAGLTEDEIGRPKLIADTMSITPAQKETYGLDFDLSGSGGFLLNDVIGLDVTGTLLAAEGAMAALPDASITPEDARLLSILHMMGHEAGHFISYSLARQVDHRSRLGGLGGSALSLLRHNHKGFSGNFVSDSRIHEERFGEGLGIQVAYAAAQKLGISAQNAAQFIDQLHAISHSAELTRPIQSGLTQVDALTHVSKSRSLGTILAKTMFTNPVLAYEGRLGYAEPLGPKELGRTVSDIMFIRQRGPQYASRFIKHRMSTYGTRTLRGDLHQRFSPPHRRLKALKVQRKDYRMALPPRHGRHAL